MGQLAVRAVLTLQAILVGEDLVVPRALQEHQRAIAEEAIELAFHTLVAGHELTLSVCVAFEVNGLDGVFGLRHFA